MESGIKEEWSSARWRDCEKKCHEGVRMTFKTSSTLSRAAHETNHALSGALGAQLPHLGAFRASQTMHLQHPAVSLRGSTHSSVSRGWTE